MGSEDALRRTPLYGVHKGAGARLVDFAGWEMPVFYSGILDEARAVRTTAGMFDVSHMGRLKIHGKDSVAFLQKLTSNDVAKLGAFEAQYSLLMHPSGGILDDIIVYREAENAFMVVINAGNADKDIAWFTEHRVGDVMIEDISATTAMIAVQGPGAPDIVSRLAEASDLLNVPRFHWKSGSIAGAHSTFCRTGYTGEDGFELIVPAGIAEEVWNQFAGEDVVACGLGARDALRIEAGYPLYGHEIDETTSPVEAGLMWATSLEKGDFVGREAIQTVQQGGATRRLVGLVLTERIVPRQGYTIYAFRDASESLASNQSSVTIGHVTSGVFSPTRNHSIGMGYVHRQQSKSGNIVEIGIRDKRLRATVVPKKSLLPS